jgi:AraC-like DNA-binding protein
MVNGWVTCEIYPDAVAWEVHQAFEISVMLSGSLKRYSEELTFEMAPGDVALSSAWEPHGWQATAPGTVGIAVCFTPELLGDEIFEGISWLDLFATAPEDRPRVETEETRGEVLAIAAGLKREIESKGRKRWETAMRLGIVRLLFVLARDWEVSGLANGRASVHPSALERITPALNLVHVRGGRPVHVEEGAASCQLSAGQFAKIFRRTMGVSFGKYVLRSRLGRGAESLLSSDAPVEVIAASLGFADTSHFHRTFAKLYGCTPNHYRGIHFHRKT